MNQVDQVLAFWFGTAFLTQAAHGSFWPEPTVSKIWFNSTSKDDKVISQQFGELVEAALNGELNVWADNANSLLALVVLLDQFPRNMFRGTSKAFAGDAKAVELVRKGIEQGKELALPSVGQVFFYMPLMHSESLADQQQCIACFEQLHQRIDLSLKSHIQNNLRFAHDHLKVIEQFGRFPHRNAVLGRESTQQELDYLKTASRYGQ